MWTIKRADVVIISAPFLNLTLANFNWFLSPNYLLLNLATQLSMHTVIAAALPSLNSSRIAPTVIAPYQSFPPFRSTYDPSLWHTIRCPSWASPRFAVVTCRTLLYQQLSRCVRGGRLLAPPPFRLLLLSSRCGPRKAHLGCFRHCTLFPSHEV